MCDIITNNFGVVFVEEENAFNKNYELLFVEGEKVAYEWEQKIYELSKKVDTEGIARLFEQAKELYFNEYYICDTIQQLTNDNSRSDKRKLIRCLKSGSKVKKLKKLKLKVLNLNLRKLLQKEISVCKAIRCNSRA